MLRTDIEYVIHSDSNGNVIGPLSKKHAHLPGPRRELTHRSTWSMVYNTKLSKYGIQLKNPKKKSKDTGGGMWDMGVAGHNCYVRDGEIRRYTSFSENLSKEALEEIGLEVTMYNDIGKFINASHTEYLSIGYIFEEFHYQTDINNERVGLGLILTTREEMQYIDDEVSDFKRLTKEELEEFLDTNQGKYCSPLPMAYEKSKTFISKTFE